MVLRFVYGPTLTSKYVTTGKTIALTRWTFVGKVIIEKERRGSSIKSAKTRPGADCGSDHELLIAKFRLKLKKVGKTTRPFTKSNPLRLYNESEK